MKIKLSAFTKGGLIGASLLLAGLFLSGIHKYDVSAQGGSECDQSSDCHLLENVGNQGNYTNGADIAKAIIKAGQNYIEFYQGNTDNDCYKININGNSIEWEKQGVGPDCKDISRIQLWKEQGEPEPSPTPTDIPTLTPPVFPYCTNQTTLGDWVHSDSGFHHIPGQEATIEGSDDIYYLNDGDFLQCLCAPDGSGNQTTWWKINDLLTPEQIASYIASGWYHEDGGAWNLLHTNYLAKNSEYNCGEPSPTPTMTPTPTPTPTETPVPTPTPTPDDDEPESSCTGLSVSPSEGTAPLTVRFNGSGYDEDGDIQMYKFDFGDNSDGQPQIWEQEESEAHHRYEYPGTYIVGLHVKDSRGNWRNGNDDCKKIIEVKGEPEVLGASTTTELPKTGTPALFGVGLASLGSLGVYLYKRFRLV